MVKNKEVCMDVIYLVGERSLEKESVLKVCASKTTAEKEWNKYRRDLIKMYKTMHEVLNKNNRKDLKEIITNLEQSNPYTQEAYPGIMPFIREEQLIP